MAYKIWTNAGVIVPTILFNTTVPTTAPDAQVRVDMGYPMLLPGKVPTTLAATLNHMAVDADIQVLGETRKVTAVSMGNPHSVRANCM